MSDICSNSGKSEFSMHTDWLFPPVSFFCVYIFLASWVWWVPAGHKCKWQRVVPKNTRLGSQTAVDWIHWAAQGKSHIEFSYHSREWTPTIKNLSHSVVLIHTITSQSTWICLCFILCVCVCVFLSEYQRGEEREGRSPGNNNHPSTTGAFVDKSLGL